MPLRFGIALDIDGVLVRGPLPLPGARSSLSRLHALSIPYCLLTNGGGITERAKASALRPLVGEIRGPVVLSHTPLRGKVLDEFRDKRVLLLGCKKETQVAEEYGFKKIVTPQELAAQHPLSYYGWGRVLPKPREDEFAGEAIEAVMIMHDPVDLHLELQVCIDVLRGRYPVVRGDRVGKQPVVINTNEDLEFSGPFEHPRLAQGAFLKCLEMLHLTVPGALGPLEIIRYGKPNKTTFEYCEQIMGPGLDRYYMIGDNPAADIRGGNLAGDHWTTIMVKSGVFQPTEEDPPDILVQGVSDAVDAIFAREGIVG